MSREHAMVTDVMTMSVALAAPTASNSKTSYLSPDVIRHRPSAHHIPVLRSHHFRLRLSTLCTKAVQLQGLRLADRLGASQGPYNGLEGKRLKKTDQKINPARSLPSVTGLSSLTTLSLKYDAYIGLTSRTIGGWKTAMMWSGALAAKHTDGASCSTARACLRLKGTL